MTYNAFAAREAVKTGLAMSLACGIALGLGWENPFWACIAVAVVSMPTVGESLNKGILRLWGTVLGGAVGLLLLGLFVQDRVAFTLCMSLYIGFCAYRITVTRHVYLWFICGYIALLIASAGIGSTSHHAFYTAMLRIQETGLGILIYALVSVFLWPQRCSDDLKLVVKNLVGVQAKTLEQYFALLSHEEEGDRAASWYGLENQLVGQLRRRLDAAETEQFEIREVREWWRQLLLQCQRLMETLEVWRETFPEIRRIELEAVLPELPALRRSLRERFRHVVALADGEEPGGEMPMAALSIDAARLREMPHLQQAAVLTFHSALGRVEAITDGLVACMRGIKEKRRHTEAMPEAGVAIVRRADSDSLLAALRGMMAIWLSTFLWIAFDPPGHMMLVVFTGVHTLMGVMSPQMNWVKFFFSNLVGVALAGALYVLVMPHLSGYTELSLLFFLLTSGIYYVFWNPRQTPLKFSAIVPFIMLTNIQNHQTYNLITFFDSAMAMLFSLPLAAVSSNAFVSLRPEKLFLRLISRYCRQAASLMGAFGSSAKPALQKRAVVATLSDMQASVGKIGGWANGIDYASLPGNTPQQAAAIVSGINTMTYRFIQLATAEEERTPSWPAFDMPLQAWRLAVGDVLRQWGASTSSQSGARALHARLVGERLRLEAESEKAFSHVPDTLRQEEYVRAYRLLGGYRGVYDALVAHAARSAEFDWDAWDESRF